MFPLVLVHGGGHGAWCWQPTQSCLRNNAVLAVDLPPRTVRGAGLSSFTEPGPWQQELETITVAQWAAAVLGEADRTGFDRFVLAGHSLGGVTITEVARIAPDRVAHLIFVSAVVPPEGGSVLDATAPGVIERASSTIEEAFREMFCSDLDDEQTRYVLDHVSTEALQPVTSPVTRRGLPRDIPVTYVRLGRDQALPPPVQQACIDRLREEVDRVDVVELDTGHDVMISQPAMLATVLDMVAGGGGDSGLGSSPPP